MSDHGSGSTDRAMSSHARLLPPKLLVVLTTCLALLCSPGITQAGRVVFTDTRIAADLFPIFPWDQLGNDPEKYKEAYECGFNMAGFAPPEQLDLASSAGLKAFVVDPLIDIRDNPNATEADITTQVQAVVSRVRSHPAVLGYHLIDEPSGKMLPNVATWVRAFNAANPPGLAFVNVLPYFKEGAAQHGGISYNDYVTSFVELAKPRALSYDHYVLMADGSIKESYYPNFEIAREQSLKAGIPFWFVGLANAHFDYMEPSYATFRFQVFTAMAYGARGIGWFTYLSRDHCNYRLTAIDYDGRRTPTWEMLRAANMQIHRLGPVYLQLKSVNVFHHPDVPKGCRGIESSRYLKSLKGKGPFLVGEFDHPNGKPYFLLVNKSLTRSTTYKLELKQPGELMKISPFTGAIDPWSGGGNFWLSPAQGMLLSVD